MDDDVRRRTTYKCRSLQMSSLCVVLLALLGTSGVSNHSFFSPVAPRGSRLPCTQKRMLHLRGGATDGAEQEVTVNHACSGEPANLVWKPYLGDEFVTLVIVRHGQSIWNKDNRFTAWMDVPLSRQGLDDAACAAMHLKPAGIRFDIAFTSVLQRAIKTCNTILEEIGQLWIPTVCDWRLNERHDGALSGLNKKLAVVQYGHENVTTWRRSYAVRPPPTDRAHPCWPGHDSKYEKLGVAPEDLPFTESLHDSLLRTKPCWDDVIAPVLREGKNVLLVTHGNIVRLLAKHIDGLSDEAIEKIDIPQCSPLVYTLRRSDLRPVKVSRAWGPLRAFFLGNISEVAVRMKSVRAETGVLFARDVRQLLRRNDWGGARAGNKAQNGTLIYSWERQVKPEKVKYGIERVMSQTDLQRSPRIKYTMVARDWRQNRINRKFC